MASVPPLGVALLIAYTIQLPSLISCSAAGFPHFSCKLGSSSKSMSSVQAFIHGPLSHASKAEARRLQETVAEYLAPMLDVITAMPAIQVI